MAGAIETRIGTGNICAAVSGAVKDLFGGFASLTGAKGSKIEAIMAADKRTKGTHNPSQSSLQRWATEGGAERGVHRKSPRDKKKQRAKKAAKKR